MQNDTVIGFLADALSCVVTVNAEHVSYALAHFPVIEASITGTATQAINERLSDVTYVYDCFGKTNPFRATPGGLEGGD